MYHSVFFTACVWEPILIYTQKGAYWKDILCLTKSMESKEGAKKMGGNKGGYIWIKQGQGHLVRLVWKLPHWRAPRAVGWCHYKWLDSAAAIMNSSTVLHYLDSSLSIKTQRGEERGGGKVLVNSRFHKMVPWMPKWGKKDPPNLLPSHSSFWNPKPSYTIYNRELIPKVSLNSGSHQSLS